MGVGCPSTSKLRRLLVKLQMNLSGVTRAPARGKAGEWPWLWWGRGGGREGGLLRVGGGGERAEEQRLPRRAGPAWPGLEDRRGHPGPWGHQPGVPQGGGGAHRLDLGFSKSFLPETPGPPSPGRAVLSFCRGAHAHLPGA